VWHVRNTDAGVASAMLNVGQQVGGSIGLSVLATVAATAARNKAQSTYADLIAQVKAGQLSPAVLRHTNELAAAQTGHKPSLAALHDPVAVQAVAEVQAHSSAQGFLAAACFGVAAILVSVFLINIKKEDVPSETPLAAAAAAA